MKLLRYGRPGEERPAMLDPEGRTRSLVGVIDDLAGEALSDGSMARLAALDPSELPEVAEGERIGPPVACVGKIMAIGLNYSDHAAETGAKPPAEPMLFMKATSSLCGPHDPIEIPPGSEKTDWEVELAVVVGKRAKRVEEATALEHVAGYTVLNDVSERAFQKERSGQFTKGKSADTFGPLGPWLVTRDEVTDPQALRLWLDVDGQRQQDGTTADMIFGVAHLVSYLSHFMTLHPGDIITTGTPAGVGLGQTPPAFLRPGQTLRFGIDGLGEQEHTIVAG